MESDTPRTDAENYIYDIGLAKWVSIEFARELERELAAAKAELVRNADELAAAIKQRDGYLALLDKALSLANEIAARYEQERDEARQEVCRMVSDADQSSNPDSAKQVAERRGWDCFAQQEGGGA